MSVTGVCLPPTSYLPPVRSIQTATEEQINASLRNLHSLYCPLRLPSALLTKSGHIEGTATPLNLVDSGYASEAEDDDNVTDSDAEDALTTLRTDVFERDFAVRWLTRLIMHVDELSIESEDSRSQILDEAAFILSSFSDTSEDNEEDALTRDFSFPTSLSSALEGIKVQLNDAPLSGTDHTDVGLQSWGASIIMSGLMCASPERFGLKDLGRNSTIVELGAGTGLVSLTIAKLLPRLATTNPTVVATDYHPAVLENLRSNIVTNFPSDDASLVQTMLLDWSVPKSEPPLDVPIPLLFAADVVYAKEHAIWLRDCAGRMLALDGSFWLMITVRKHGKFEGIPETVEAAFARWEECPKKSGKTLKILEKEMHEKQRGIGRGDETGYMLYRIGWTT